MKGFAWFFKGSIAILLGVLVWIACNTQTQADNASCERHPDKWRTISMSPDVTDLRDQLQEKEVVLTFDDGPHGFGTRKVLDVLDAYCVPSTFFLLGINADKYPKLVREIAVRGHSIGSHGYRHLRLTEMGLDRAVEEVLRGKAAIDTALSVEGAARETTLFRFPYVATTPELNAAVQAQGISIVGVHSDGADWERNTPKESTDLIFEKLAQNEFKGVILLHDPFPNSAARLEALLERLTEENYKFVHLTDLK